MIRVAAPALLACLLYGPAWAQTPKAGELVDLNTATMEELLKVPGLGTLSARKIVEGRPFKSVDDLKRIGLTEATIDKVRPLVTVKGAETTKKAMTPEPKKAEAPEPKKATEPTTAKKAETPTAKKAEEPAATKGEDLVDLNSATAEELETLPGVGPATSKRIIENRPYKSIDDLKTAGLIPTAIEKIRPLATVKGVEPARTATPTARKAEAKKAAAAPTTAGLVDLNTAKQAEIEDLPGIGPATAKAIIDGRPYKSIDELDKVKGLGTAKIAALRDKVKVGEPAAEPTKTKTAAAEPVAKKAEMKTAAKEKAKPATVAPGQKVNLNTATKEELDALPGIGPVKAQAIIDGRPYKTLEGLKDVKGIGDVTFEKLKDLITID